MGSNTSTTIQLLWPGGNCMVCIDKVVARFNSIWKALYLPSCHDNSSLLLARKVFVCRVQIKNPDFKRETTAGSTFGARRITKIFTSKKGYLDVRGSITLNCTYLVCIWYLMTFTDNIISTFIGFLSWHIATVMAVGWTEALSRWNRLGQRDDPSPAGSSYHFLSSSHARNFQFVSVLWPI